MPYQKNNLRKNIGQKVILTENKTSISGKFNSGDLVTISDMDPDRGYTFMDEEGNKVIEAGFTGFIKS